MFQSLPNNRDLDLYQSKAIKGTQTGNMAKTVKFILVLVIIENHIYVCLPLFSLNFLPNNKVLAMSKLKAFADNKIDVVKMMISLLDRIEKTVGKGENAGYQHFFPFPTVLSKAFFLKVVKSRDCGNRVNSLLNEKILDWTKLKASANKKINIQYDFSPRQGRKKTLWERVKMLHFFHVP